MKLNSVNVLLVAASLLVSTVKDVAGLPWTPAAGVTNMVAWYDAAETSTITESGGSVSQWDDKSGNTNHMKAGGSSRPMTGVDSIAGLNSISFGGHPEHMGTDSNPFGASISNAFAIIVIDIKTIADGCLFSLTGSHSSSARWNAFCPYGDGKVMFDCGGHSAPNRIQYTSSWSTNDVKMMGFYCSVTDSAQEIWEDGTKKASDASGHTVPTAQGIQIGWDGLLGGDVVAVGEMVVIDGTISTEDRQTLEGYLAWKWGLESNLPTDHPYQERRPGPPLGTVIKFH